MSLLDDLKTKADLNKDGKLSIEDLESLKDGTNNAQLDQLIQLADQNDDGTLGLDDIKNFDFNKVLDNLKDGLTDKLGGIFSGK